MDWTLRELQYLVAVVDAGSFTDGAIDMRLSQAAISRSIAGVENRLGQRLLHRTTRGCDPTPLGAQLVDQARRVLVEVARLDELSDGRTRPLRLGYAWAAVGRHTTPLIRWWVRRHPDIDLELLRINSPSAGLSEGRCDAAIMRIPVEPDRLDSVVIGLERRLAAFAADDREWARRRQLTMAEVAERIVVVDPRTGTTTSELWRGAHRPERFVTCSELDEWFDAIAAGRGVGTTAEATAAHHTRPGVVFRPISDGPRIPVHLAWWRDDPPARLPELIDMLTDLYQRGSVRRPSTSDQD